MDSLLTEEMYKNSESSNISTLLLTNIVLLKFYFVNKKEKNIDIKAFVSQQKE